ncbi:MULTISPECIES: hypothetical protein [Streptomyces]|uniref:Lipoprotein n=1 Tax=Streptomyces flavovirens TaxID=52258 RepID=A0ABV8N893_9ACTN|nr:hypothetical protein [Streptomyces sp. MBT51]MBK3595926.1 hypothetical protein [Streptomyces sp. MBT51]
MMVSLTITASGCTSDDSTEPQAKAELCRLAPDSSESRTLRQLLGEDDVRTDISHDGDDLAESMRDWLKPGGPERSALPLRMCSYRPEKITGADMVSIEFGWLSRDAVGKKANKLPGKVRHYDVNGATVQANDIVSRLTVPCRMPGGLEKASQKVLFQGEASNTLLTGTDVQQKTIDQQVTFLYLMTRRATEALDCANDPLARKPVVKPSPAPTA